MTATCRHRRALATALLAVVAVTAILLFPGRAAARRSGPAAPTLQQLVGQRLVVAMSGTAPDASLLARIRAGEVGGVILFGANIVSPAQLTHLTATLQAAAHAGGQPRLIICTDQEGGEVKRIPWAPPNRSAQQLGALPSSQSTLSGSMTAAALAADGVNVDLAPVADVPAGPADFIEQQHRAFSTSRFTVALDAGAFAGGLEAHGVWPTLKHFPGLGLATVSTDVALVTIDAPAATLNRDLLPYQVAFRRSLDPIVMLSTAIYPAYDFRAAAWSPPIIQGILRGTLGFGGVTMSDSLDSAAAVRHVSDASLAVRSAEAGNDLVLVTGSEADGAGVYNALLSAARSGALTGANLNASYARITALKSRL
ncbi:MAG TPA: glycoside hydrolase family 3 N-terminal domain-containing protein [Thermoleophilia bacterium]|nr:glycoside hydrolase family 3 N-terminal domain-containing protein [Thermoleophilia bacterium]